MNTKTLAYRIRIDSKGALDDWRPIQEAFDKAVSMKKQLEANGAPKNDPLLKALNEDIKRMSVVLQANQQFYKNAAEFIENMNTRTTRSLKALLTQLERELQDLANEGAAVELRAEKRRQYAQVEEEVLKRDVKIRDIESSRLKLSQLSNNALKETIRSADKLLNLEVKGTEEQKKALRARIAAQNEADRREGKMTGRQALAVINSKDDVPLETLQKAHKVVKTYIDDFGQYFDEAMGARFQARADLALQKIQDRARKIATGAIPATFDEMALAKPVLKAMRGALTDEMSKEITGMMTELDHRIASAKSSIANSAATLSDADSMIARSRSNVADTEKEVKAIQSEQVKLSQARVDAAQAEAEYLQQSAQAEKERRVEQGKLTRQKNKDLAAAQQEAADVRASDAQFEEVRAKDARYQKEMAKAEAQRAQATTNLRVVQSDIEEKEKQHADTQARLAQARQMQLAAEATTSEGRLKVEQMLTQEMERQASVRAVAEKQAAAFVQNEQKLADARAGEARAVSEQTARRLSIEEKRQRIERIKNGEETATLGSVTAGTNVKLNEELSSDKGGVRLSLDYLNKAKDMLDGLSKHFTSVGKEVPAEFQALQRDIDYTEKVLTEGIKSAHVNVSKEVADNFMRSASEMVAQIYTAVEDAKRGIVGKGFSGLANEASTTRILDKNGRTVSTVETPALTGLVRRGEVLDDILRSSFGESTEVHDTDPRIPVRGKIRMFLGKEQRGARDYAMTALNAGTFADERAAVKEVFRQNAALAINDGFGRGDLMTDLLGSLSSRENIQAFAGRLREDMQALADTKKAGGFADNGPIDDYAESLQNVLDLTEKILAASEGKTGKDSIYRAARKEFEQLTAETEQYVLNDLNKQIASAGTKAERESLEAVREQVEKRVAMMNEAVEVLNPVQQRRQQKESIAELNQAIKEDKQAIEKAEKAQKSFAFTADIAESRQLRLAKATDEATQKAKEQDKVVSNLQSALRNNPIDAAYTRAADEAAKVKSDIAELKKKNKEGKNDASIASKQAELDGLNETVKVLERAKNAVADRYQFELDKIAELEKAKKKQTEEYKKALTLVDSYDNARDEIIETEFIDEKTGAVIYTEQTVYQQIAAVAKQSGKTVEAFIDEQRQIVDRYKENQDKLDVEIEKHRTLSSVGNEGWRAAMGEQLASLAEGTDEYNKLKKQIDDYDAGLAYQTKLIQDNAKEVETLKKEEKAQRKELEQLNVQQKEQLTVLAQADAMLASRERLRGNIADRMKEADASKEKLANIDAEIARLNALDPKQQAQINYEQKMASLDAERKKALDAVTESQNNLTKAQQDYDRAISAGGGVSIKDLRDMRSKLAADRELLTNEGDIADYSARIKKLDMRIRELEVTPAFTFAETMNEVRDVLSRRGFDVETVNAASKSVMDAKAVAEQSFLDLQKVEQMQGEALLEINQKENEYIRRRTPLQDKLNKAQAAYDEAHNEAKLKEERAELNIQKTRRLNAAADYNKGQAAMQEAERHKAIAESLMSEDEETGRIVKARKEEAAIIGQLVESARALVNQVTVEDNQTARLNERLAYRQKQLEQRGADTPIVKFVTEKVKGQTVSKRDKDGRLVTEVRANQEGAYSDEISDKKKAQNESARQIIASAVRHSANIQRQIEAAQYSNEQIRAWQPLQSELQRLFGELGAAIQKSDIKASSEVVSKVRQVLAKNFGNNHRFVNHINELLSKNPGKDGYLEVLSYLGGNPVNGMPSIIGHINDRTQSFVQPEVNSLMRRNTSLKARYADMETKSDAEIEEQLLRPFEKRLASAQRMLNRLNKKEGDERDEHKIALLEHRVAYLKEKVQTIKSDVRKYYDETVLAPMRDSMEGYDRQIKLFSEGRAEEAYAVKVEYLMKQQARLDKTIEKQAKTLRANRSEWQKAGDEVVRIADRMQKDEEKRIRQVSTIAANGGSVRDDKGRASGAAVKSQMDRFRQQYIEMTMGTAKPTVLRDKNDKDYIDPADPAFMQNNSVFTAYKEKIKKKGKASKVLGMVDSSNTAEDYFNQLTERFNNLFAISHENPVVQKWLEQTMQAVNDVMVEMRSKLTANDRAFRDTDRIRSDKERKKAQDAIYADYQKIIQSGTVKLQTLSDALEKVSVNMGLTTEQAKAQVKVEEQQKESLSALIARHKEAGTIAELDEAQTKWYNNAVAKQTRVIQDNYKERNKLRMQEIDRQADLARVDNLSQQVAKANAGSPQAQKLAKQAVELGTLGAAHIERKSRLGQISKSTEGAGTRLAGYSDIEHYNVLIAQESAYRDEVQKAITETESKLAKAQQKLTQATTPDAKREIGANIVQYTEKLRLLREESANTEATINRLTTAMGQAAPDAVKLWEKPAEQIAADAKTAFEKAFRAYADAKLQATYGDVFNMSDEQKQKRQETLSKREAEMRLAADVLSPAEVQNIKREISLELRQDIIEKRTKIAQETEDIKTKALAENLSDEEREKLSKQAQGAFNRDAVYEQHAEFLKLQSASTEATTQQTAALTAEDEAQQKLTASREKYHEVVQSLMEATRGAKVSEAFGTEASINKWNDRLQKATEAVNASTDISDADRAYYDKTVGEGFVHSIGAKIQKEKGKIEKWSEERDAAADDAIKTKLSKNITESETRIKGWEDALVQIKSLIADAEKRVAQFGESDLAKAPGPAPSNPTSPASDPVTSLQNQTKGVRKDNEELKKALVDREKAWFESMEKATAAAKIKEAGSTDNADGYYFTKGLVDKSGTQVKGAVQQTANNFAIAEADAKAKSEKMEAQNADVYAKVRSAALDESIKFLEKMYNETQSKLDRDVKSGYDAATATPAQKRLFLQHTTMLDEIKSRLAQLRSDASMLENEMAARGIVADIVFDKAEGKTKDKVDDQDKKRAERDKKRKEDREKAEKQLEATDQRMADNEQRLENNRNIRITGYVDQQIGKIKNLIEARQQDAEADAKAKGLELANIDKIKAALAELDKLRFEAPESVLDRLDKQIDDLKGEITEQEIKLNEVLAGEPSDERDAKAQKIREDIAAKKTKIGSLNTSKDEINSNLAARSAESTSQIALAEEKVLTEAFTGMMQQMDASEKKLAHLKSVAQDSARAYKEYMDGLFNDAMSDKQKQDEARLKQAWKDAMADYNRQRAIVAEKKLHSGDSETANVEYQQSVRTLEQFGSLMNKAKNEYFEFRNGIDKQVSKMLLDPKHEAERTKVQLLADQKKSSAKSAQAQQEQIRQEEIGIRGTITALQDKREEIDSMMAHRKEELKAYNDEKAAAESLMAEWRAADAAVQHHTETVNQLVEAQKNQKKSEQDLAKAQKEMADFEANLGDSMMSSDEADRRRTELKKNHADALAKHQANEAAVRDAQEAERAARADGVASISELKERLALAQNLREYGHLDIKERQELNVAIADTERQISRLNKAMMSGDDANDAYIKAQEIIKQGNYATVDSLNEVVEAMGRASEAEGITAKQRADYLATRKAAQDILNKPSKSKSASGMGIDQINAVIAQGADATTDSIHEAIKALRAMQEQEDTTGKKSEMLAKKIKKLEDAAKGVDSKTNETFITKVLADIEKGGGSLKDMEKALRILDEQIKTIDTRQARFAQKREDYLRLKKAFDDMNATLDKTRKGIDGVNDGLKKQSDWFTTNIKKLANYLGVFGGFYLVRQEFQKFFQSSLKYDDALTDIRKTANLTDEQVRLLADGLKRIDTRTSIDNINALAYSAGKLGTKSVSDIMGFVRAADMLNVSLGEQLGQDATEKLMKIANIMGTTQAYGLEDALTRTGSAITYLAKNSAASGDAIVAFMSRTAGLSRQAGVTTAELAGLASAVSALNQPVEMSATSFSKMMVQMEKSYKTVGKALKMTDSEMERMRLNMETGHAMESFLDMLRRVKEMGGLSQTAAIAKDLGSEGNRVIQTLTTLSSNYETIEKMVRQSTDAFEENTTVLDEYNKKNQNVAALWEKLKNNFSKMFISPEANDLLRDLLLRLQNLPDAINSVIKSVKPFAKWIGGYLVDHVYGLIHALRDLIVVLALRSAWVNISNWIGVAAQAFSALNNAIKGKAIPGIFALRRQLVLTTNGFNKAHIRAKMFFTYLKGAQWGNIFTAVIAALVTMGELLWNNRKEAKKWGEEIADAIGRIEAAARKGTEDMEKMLAALSDENLADSTRMKYINKLNDMYGEYLGNIDLERMKYEDLAIAVRAANKQLQAKQIMEAAETKVRDLESANITEQSEDFTNLVNAIQSRLPEGTDKGVALQIVEDMMREGFKDFLTIGGDGKFIEKGYNFLVTLDEDYTRMQAALNNILQKYAPGANLLSMEKSIGRSEAESEADKKAAGDREWFQQFEQYGVAFANREQDVKRAVQQIWDFASAKASLELNADIDKEQEGVQSAMTELDQRMNKQYAIFEQPFTRLGRFTPDAVRTRQDEDNWATDLRIIDANDPKARNKYAEAAGAYLMDARNYLTFMKAEKYDEESIDSFSRKLENIQQFYDQYSLGIVNENTDEKTLRDNAKKEYEDLIKKIQYFYELQEQIVRKENITEVAREHKLEENEKELNAMLSVARKAIVGDVTDAEWRSFLKTIVNIAGNEGKVAFDRIAAVKNLSGIGAPFKGDDDESSAYLSGIRLEGSKNDTKILELVRKRVDAIANAWYEFNPMAQVSRQFQQEFERLNLLAEIKPDVDIKGVQIRNIEEVQDDLMAQMREIGQHVIEYDMSTKEGRDAFVSYIKDATVFPDVVHNARIKTEDDLNAFYYKAYEFAEQYDERMTRIISRQQNLWKKMFARMEEPLNAELDKLKTEQLQAMESYLQNFGLSDRVNLKDEVNQRREALRLAEEEWKFMNKQAETEMAAAKASGNEKKILLAQKQLEALRKPTEAVLSAIRELDKALLADRLASRKWLADSEKATEQFGKDIFALRSWYDNKGSLWKNAFGTKEDRQKAFGAYMDDLKKTLRDAIVERVRAALSAKIKERLEEAQLQEKLSKEEQREKTLQEAQKKAGEEQNDIHQNVYDKKLDIENRYYEASLDAATQYVEELNAIYGGILTNPDAFEAQYKAVVQDIQSQFDDALLMADNSNSVPVAPVKKNKTKEEEPEPKYKEIWVEHGNIRKESDASYLDGHPLKNQKRGIVIHHTGEYGKNTMHSVLGGFTNPKSGTSAHMVIDYDGTRYRLANDDDVTWHAGAGSHWRSYGDPKFLPENNDGVDKRNANDYMIGVEMRGDTDQKDLTEDQIASLVEALKPIIIANQIPLENIVSHGDVTVYDTGPKKGKSRKADVNARNLKLVKDRLAKEVYYEGSGLPLSAEEAEARWSMETERPKSVPSEPASVVTETIDESVVPVIEDKSDDIVEAIEDLKKDEHKDEPRGLGLIFSDKQQEEQPLPDIYEPQGDASYITPPKPAPTTGPMIHPNASTRSEDKVGESVQTGLFNASVASLPDDVSLWGDAIVGYYHETRERMNAELQQMIDERMAAFAVLVGIEHDEAEQLHDASVDQNDDKVKDNKKASDKIIKQEKQSSKTEYNLQSAAANALTGLISDSTRTQEDLKVSLARNVMNASIQYGAEEFAAKAAQTEAEDSMTAKSTIFKVLAGIAGGSSKTISELGWWGLPLIAVISTSLSALLSAALNAIPSGKKAKAPATKAKLVSGMLTYDRGNVQSIPAYDNGIIDYDMDDDGTYAPRYLNKSKIPVMADDGRVYMVDRNAMMPSSGTGMVTRPTLTTIGGVPSLIGERGPEMVIGRETTAAMQMYRPDLLRQIQLFDRNRSNGFAKAYDSGNVQQTALADGASGEDLRALLAANQEMMAQLAAAQAALVDRLNRPINATINKNGAGGLVETVAEGFVEARQRGNIKNVSRLFGSRS